VLAVLSDRCHQGVSKSFRSGRLERELQTVKLSATRCSCIAILWVSLASLAAITLCVASERLFVVYFVMDSVRKLLDTASYAEQLRSWSTCIRIVLRLCNTCSFKVSLNTETSCNFMVQYREFVICRHASGLRYYSSVAVKVQSHFPYRKSVNVILENGAESLRMESRW
jgi:hypothetical protein